MNIDVCRMDSLLDYTIPIDTFGVRNIVMHKRAGISLIGNAMGWATYEDSDIVVASENLAEQVRKIEIAVSTDSIVQVYSVGANYFWRTIGLSLTSDSANRLCRNLLRKEFGKCGKAAITDKLLRDVVTHELKHKYDEKMLLGTRRIAMDAEISAHLTEAIYGQSPLYALFLYTQRLQYFYVNVQQPEVHTALKPLIIEAWNLAIKVSNNTATTQDVVTTLKKRYAVYVTLTGSAFPSLGLFDNAIIKKKLQKIPEYRM
jgi:hypothetical protein